MKPAKIYTYTVPAGGSVNILVEGSFFKVLACAGPVSVTGDFGKLGPILAGQGLRGQNSSNFMVNDESGADNVVRILIADDGFIDDRISGEVSVIDGGKARTYSGQAFCSAQYCAAIAAQYSYVQLMNPAGSGKIVVLEGFSASSNALSGIAAGIYSTPLTTSTINAISKLAGGAAGVAQRRTQNNAVAWVVSANQSVAAQVNTGSVLIINLREPVVLPPGNGFVVMNTTLGNDLTCTFEHFEEVLG